MSFGRSILAILGGIGLVSLITQLLETTLVGAAAGGQVMDMPHYFAVRNRPSILAAGLVYNTVAAVLGGYMTARIAGQQEMAHARIAALVLTASLIYGFTAGEFAQFTPAWMRIALIVLTAPAMLAGAMIRQRAARHQAQETTDERPETPL
jgi:hypothetical protein